MLEWSEEKKPDGKVSRYNHVTAEAGPILFTIEWKAWKENDSRTLTASWRDGGGELFLGAHASTDTAKVAALAWLASIPVPKLPDGAEPVPVACQDWEPLLKRARQCLSLGERTGSRGSAPTNVYNVLADMIVALDEANRHG